MLCLVKQALRVTDPDYDQEIAMLIAAAKADLGVAGVTGVFENDPLIARAITTYCKANFGNPVDAERLKKSYDEQKAQLSMHTGHTDWRAPNV